MPAGGPEGKPLHPSCPIEDEAFVAVGAAVASQRLDTLVQVLTSGSGDVGDDGEGAAQVRQPLVGRAGQYLSECEIGAIGVEEVL